VTVRPFDYLLANVTRTGTNPHLFVLLLPFMEFHRVPFKELLYVLYHCPQAISCQYYFYGIMFEMGTFNPKRETLLALVREHPGEYTVRELAQKTGLTRDAVSAIIRRASEQEELHVIKEKSTPQPLDPLVEKELIYPKRDTTNVLVIGDIHPPFDLDEYLEFCKDQYKRWKCTHVIFAGDVTDQYNFSRFDKDPDMLSSSEELDQAYDRLQRWYKAFTKADLCAGNHDLRYMRKAYGAGLPRRLIRSFQSVFDLHQWNIREEYFYDGVLYIHGEGKSAERRARNELVSVVSGHEHSQAYVKWFQGRTSRHFAMQVGCGVDQSSRAFEYGKHSARPIIGVGVVLNNGKLPINIVMP